ncbi:MAG TPA: methyltransferase [Micrococcaceae bacterium]|nr:methyltransferase [Micrococcaceae bacterium]
MGSDHSSADHYFSAQPAGPEKRRPLTVVLDGESRNLTTSAGIFSPDGVDKGTAILLAEAPPPSPTGNLLDIGCGWGPVALTLALRSPEASVYAVDVNSRCVALTNDNAAALGLGNVTASRPEEVDAALEFSTIWSNPPIRVGKEELHALLLHWLPRLAPGGSAYLVVQKNLGSDSLQRWLDAQLRGRFPAAGFRVSRESTAKSFRILKVARPD